MRNRLVLTLVVLVVLALSGVAAAATSSVTINPVGFAFGIFNGQYEKMIDERSSFVAGASFLGLNNGYWKIGAFSLDGGQRTYLNGTAPEGFFLEGKGGVEFVSATYDDGWSSSSGSGTVFTGTASAGYKWIGNGGFTTEIAAGGSAAFGSVRAGSQTAPVAGFSPVLAVNFGYSW